MEKTFRKIINEIIAPVFISNGFKKKGDTFAKENADLAFVVKIYDHWLNADEVSFTLRTGIFTKELFGTYFMKRVPKFPVLNDSIYQLNISKLAKRSHEWYKLNTSTDLFELTKLIIEDINSYILPHFESISTINKLIDNLEQEEGFLWKESPHFLTILYQQNGYIKCAQERMNKVYEKCEFAAQREFTKVIADRLGIVIEDQP
ncbi:DUF4304 domain-containing protein [Gottfriedia acidiceleris]|uniref:DUF4304 domain-containing protein n=1 Tax=Gottfriedia acidiceleris TaxID=371036 RepID=UPI002FFFB2DB